MHIGVPKEIKVLETRVGLTPESARVLTEAGHEVCVETHAGIGSGFPDDDYHNVGAVVVSSAADVYARSELIIKVKEPQLEECAMLNKQHVLFTFLHLAAVPEIEQALIDSGCTAIAYETVTAPEGGLPLLKPMSAVAGCVAIQASATALQKSHGGSGVLMHDASVLVLGAGTAGSNAAELATGMGAKVTVVDHYAPSLEQLRGQLGELLGTAKPEQISELIKTADLVIGAALLPGKEAPRLVTRAMLKTMRPGSVIVDISIDQGGCCETSRPTTLSDPTYVEEGVVHYCVTNMPGDVPRSSTFALNKVTLPFVKEIADKGWQRACEDDPHLADGVSISAGQRVDQDLEPA